MDSSGREGGLTQTLATSRGTLAAPAVRWEVGDQARLENARALVRRLNAPIAVERGAAEGQPDLLGPLRQGVQPLRHQAQVRLLDGSNRQGGQDIAHGVRDRDDGLALLVLVA